MLLFCFFIAMFKLLVLMIDAEGVTVRKNRFHTLWKSKLSREGIYHTGQSVFAHSERMILTRIAIINVSGEKEWVMMGRNKGIMSQRLKEEIAKELGFYNVVEKDGWGGITAKDAGNMVKRAVEIAQQNLQNRS